MYIKALPDKYMTSSRGAMCDKNKYYTIYWWLPGMTASHSTRLVTVPIVKVRTFFYRMKKKCFTRLLIAILNRAEIHNLRPRV